MLILSLRKKLRKRTATNKEEFDSVKKKRKTVAVVTEEESEEEEWFTCQVNHRNLQKREMTILLFNRNIQDLLLEWALIGKHPIMLLSITIAVIAEMKVNHWMKTLRYTNTHAYTQILAYTDTQSVHLMVSLINTLGVN